MQCRFPVSMKSRKVWRGALRDVACAAARDDLRFSFNAEMTFEGSRNRIGGLRNLTQTALNFVTVNCQQHKERGDYSMNSRLAIMFSLILIAGGTGCATSQPIENIVDRPVPVNVDGSARALEEVKAAIIEGCQAKRWSAVMDGGARIKCSILVRGRHYAEVIIPDRKSVV